MTYWRVGQMAKRRLAGDSTVLAAARRIEHAILMIRGQRVMLDVDLAVVYQVSVKRLNQAVKRNAGRFPDDFMFRLSQQEFASLRSQIVTSNSRGGRRYPPFAFTEHGAVMLATVLNSPVAVQASIEVVRAFVRLRQFLASNEELRRKLDEMEKKYDEQFGVVFEAIRQLMEGEDEQAGVARPRIGYQTEAGTAGGVRRLSRGTPRPR